MQICIQNSIYSTSNQADNIEQIYQEIRLAGKQMKFWNDKIQIAYVLDFYNNNPAYRESFNLLQQAFEQDSSFKQACFDLTAKILGDKVGITEDNKLVGVKYLLHELPFFYS